jgi:type VI secretion system secreted protein Hcp
MLLLNFEKKIKGSSTAKGYEEWIEIEDINFGGGRYFDNSSQHRNPDKAFHSDISVRKKVDVSTPEIWYQALEGNAFGKAELVMLQSGGKDKPLQEVFKITLTNPMILQFNCEVGSGIGNEKFNINSTKIEVEYNTYDAKGQKGKVNKMYDLTTQS